MTVQDQFDEAIYSLFNLDNNIFILATVEAILEKVKESDYRDVILYLAKRKSDYESPLESLAKGIDEFYVKRRDKLFDYAYNHSMHIDFIITSLVKSRGEDKAISLITAGSTFKINDEIIKVTSQDIYAINQHGGLKQLIDNREHIGDILHRHLSQNINNEFNELLLLK